MRILIKNILTGSMAITSLIMGVTMVAAAGEQEASAIVDQYIYALRSGDTDMILELMGNEERERSEFIATEPGYGQSLVQRYQNASYKVVGIESSKDMYAFELEIQINPAEKIKETLVLKPSSADGVDYQIIKRLP